MRGREKENEWVTLTPQKISYTHHWYTSIKVFPFKLYFIHLLSLVFRGAMSMSAEMWNARATIFMAVCDIYEVDSHCMFGFSFSLSVSLSLSRTLSQYSVATRSIDTHGGSSVTVGSILCISLAILCSSLSNTEYDSLTVCDIMHDYTLQELTRLETATAVTMK